MLDKNQVVKRDRFFIAMILLSLSALVSFGSYMMYMQPKQEPNYEAKRDADMKACMSFARHKGFSADRTGISVLTLVSEKFDDPKFSFSSMESVVLACNNIEVKSMCFGLSSHCSVNGTKIVLNYEEPSVY